MIDTMLWTQLILFLPGYLLYFLWARRKPTVFMISTAAYSVLLFNAAGLGDIMNWFPYNLLAHILPSLTLVFVIHCGFF